MVERHTFKSFFFFIWIEYGKMFLQAAILLPPWSQRISPTFLRQEIEMTFPDDILFNLPPSPALTEALS